MTVLKTAAVAGSKHKDQPYKKRPTQSNNQKYVNRGKNIVPRKDPKWKEELKEANTKKNGAPFQYADSLIELIGIFRAATKSSFRVVTGMISEILGEGAPFFFECATVSHTGTKGNFVKEIW